jgi:sugar phosphate isomerase/epimerase
MSGKSFGRRSFLRGVAGTTVAVGAASLAGPAAGASAADGGLPLVPNLHFGIQLWSIRDKIEESGFEVVLEQVAAVGYKTVEFAGYSDDWGGTLTAAQTRQLLDDNGLTAISSHRPLDAFRNSLEQELEIASTLGLSYLGTPEAPPGNFGDDSEKTADSYRRAADDFNTWGAQSVLHGIKMFQHNHTVEFSYATDEPRTRLIDVFLRHTDPRLVCLQMDVLWAYGGARMYPGFEPIDYLKNHPARYPMLHLKDGVPLADPMQDNSYQDVEFGLGVIPYTEFLSELTGRRDRYEYFWEQDSGPEVLPNPPGSFGAADRSYRRIRGLRSCGVGR